MTGIDDERPAWLKADDRGLVVAVNSRFTADFGWDPAELVGRSLLTLIPAPYHDSHNLGFARLVEFGRPSVLGQPMRLPLVTFSGTIVETEMCLQAEKLSGRWCIAAHLVRIDEKEPR